MIRAVWFPSTLMLISALGCFFHWVFFIPFTIFVFDVYGRKADFEFLSSVTRRRRTLYFDRFKRSYCSRQVYISVVGPKAIEMFHTEGYRWYHVFPDDSFHPTKTPFAKKAFWVGLVKGY